MTLTADEVFDSMGAWLKRGTPADEVFVLTLTKEDARTILDHVEEKSEAYLALLRRLESANDDRNWLSAENERLTDDVLGRPANEVRVVIDPAHVEEIVRREVHNVLRDLTAAMRINR